MSPAEPDRAVASNPGGSAVLRRELDPLEAETFDVAVVGAGIHGAWAALDAAGRGLRVALVEQGDMGHATSANSQRIVHGGLRYLQHGDLRRFRQSVRERSTLLRLAPHLVRPLAVLVPTQGAGLRGRAVLGAALRVNDLLSWRRNRGVPASGRIPGGELVSRDRCLEIFSGFDPASSGGALFHDAQVCDSERMCLAVVQSARKAGAEVANYVRLTDWSYDGPSVVGFEALDLVGQRKLKIRARQVVVCAGPWTAGIGAKNGRGARQSLRFPVLRAVVLVTRPIVQGAGVALAGRPGFEDDAELVSKGFRNYFVTPWRDRSLIGTYYTAWGAAPDELGVSPNEVRGFVEEFNAISPRATLATEDVTHVFVGLVPREKNDGSEGQDFAKQYRIVDHGKEEGFPGRITVVGVKWTTARQVAEEAIDLAVRNLGRDRARCTTASSPLHGGDMSDLDDYLERQRPLRPVALAEASFDRLVATYGTGYHEVLAWCRAEPGLMQPIVQGRPEIRAQVVHAVRVEMAQTLGDVIFRRLGVGTTGWPGNECVEICATIMARELGWDDRRTALQIEDVERVYRRVGVRP